jgi:uncharacterized protein (DUF2384 family)
MTEDQQLLQKAAGKAGEKLGLTEWADDSRFLLLWSLLYAQLGGDEVLMRHWTQTPNKDLNGKVPANLIVDKQGLEELVNLLDSYLY